MVRVHRYVDCFVDDDCEVADLVADVFALAWVKLDHLRPLGLVWLLRAADNKIRDRERSLRARAKAMDDMRSISAWASPGDLLDSMAVRQSVAESLTPREKRIVMFFYWDRLAAGEIAEEMDCSQAAIFTALSRARAKIEAHLVRGTRVRAPHAAHSKTRIASHELV